MPIYEYQCQECGAISEFFVGMGEDGPLVCKKCGSNRVEKVLSVSAVLSRVANRAPGKTCCGREERCSAPPCSTGGACRKDQA